MKKIQIIAALLIVSIIVILSACGTKKKNTEDSISSSADSSETLSSSNSGEYKVQSFSYKTLYDATFPSLSIQTYKVNPNAVQTISFPDFSLSGIQPYVAKDPSELSEKEQEEIVRKHKELMAKLDKAFKSYNIKVAINQATGEAALDSSVLFGGDSAELTKSGKSFLKSFISAYSSVLLDKDFDGFIAKILVEGHTAPVGENSYEKGLPLSKERADAVMNYCLSDECGLSGESIASLKKIMETHGLSDAFPVKDKNGNVDMEASRRVSFKFVINI